MKKLKLDLEDLSVESFATTPEPRAEGGTVFGQQCTCYTQCTCPGCPTCDASCNGTCADSCDFSCGDTCGDTCFGCNATYGQGPIYYNHCVIYPDNGFN